MKKIRIECDRKTYELFNTMNRKAFEDQMLDYLNEYRPEIVCGYGFYGVSGVTKENGRYYVLCDVGISC